MHHPQGIDILRHMREMRNRVITKVQRNIAIEMRIFFVLLMGGSFFAAFLRNMYMPMQAVIMLAPRANIQKGICLYESSSLP
jgi:hypothetical protein